MVQNISLSRAREYTTMIRWYYNKTNHIMSDSGFTTQNRLENTLLNTLTSNQSQLIRSRNQWEKRKSHIKHSLGYISRSTLSDRPHFTFTFTHQLVLTTITISIIIHLLLASELLRCVKTYTNSLLYKNFTSI